MSAQDGGLTLRGFTMYQHSRFVAQQAGPRWPRARYFLPCVDLLGVCALLVLAGCTTVGSHSRTKQAAIDYGPAAVMRVCVLKTEDVKVQRPGALLEAVNDEFAPYGITVEVPWIRPWTRPGFEVGAMMQDLIQRDLEPPCDRLVGFVDRNVGDFLWAFVMPEVLGAVDDITATHGYVVATSASVNQIFVTPSAATVHEFYHLLGCPHGLSLVKCYGQIAALKAAIVPDADFFPGVTKEGGFLTTRDAANAAMRSWIAEQEAKKTSKPAGKGADGVTAAPARVEPAEAPLPPGAGNAPVAEQSGR
jgi:hypothetical protein